MKIYEASPNWAGQADASKIAAAVAVYLYPAAQIVSAADNQTHITQVLRGQDHLLGLVFHRNEVTNDWFEHVLVAASQLERSRKEKENVHLREIKISIIASRFSDDFVARAAAWPLVQQLCEWSLIQSGTGSDLLIKRVATEHHGPVSPPKEPRFVEVPSKPARASTRGDLSQAEMVAFARLGQGLRTHRARSKP